jgi:hypothetical protein
MARSEDCWTKSALQVWLLNKWVDPQCQRVQRHALRRRSTEPTANILRGYYINPCQVLARRRRE